MKIFRSITLVLGMACAAALGSVLGLASLVVEPLLRVAGNACRKGADGIAQLDRELAHKFAEKMASVAQADSSLRREGQGFRQDSSMPDVTEAQVLAGRGASIC